jgi:hypothetical protein
MLDDVGRYDKIETLGLERHRADIAEEAPAEPLCRAIA